VFVERRALRRRAEPAELMGEVGRPYRESWKSDRAIDGVRW
jgi:hypothetical protein